MPITYDKAGAVAEIRTRIQDSDDKLQDGGTGTVLEQFLEDALAQYTHDRPRSIAADFTVGVTDTKFITPLPTEWDLGYSTLAAVEFPKDEVPPAFLDPAGWYVQEELNRIAFVTARGAGAVLRLWFRSRHKINGYSGATATTIPVSEFMAVVLWASAAACHALAAYYANTSQPSFAADLTNFRSKHGEYSDRAKKYEERYREIVKPAASEEGPRSGFASWKPTLGAAGLRPFFHSP